MDTQTHAESDLPTEDELEHEAQTRFTGMLSIYKVARAEDRKLLCIGSMFVMAIYVHLLCKDIKDAFVISRQVPASISVLKVFWIPPIAMSFSLITQKMLAKMCNDKVLRVFLCCYSCYFFMYGAVILPFRDSGIEMDRMYTIDFLSDGKMAFKDFISFAASIMTFTSWTSTFHYTLSEVWGTMVYNVLILQMTSEVCTEKQLKRFLPVLYSMCSIGHFLCAVTLYGTRSIVDALSYRYRWCFFSLVFFILGSVAVGLLAMHAYLKNTVVPVKICRSVQKERQTVSKKKIGFVEGLRLIASTNVMIALCAMVLGYNIMILMNDSSYKSCQNEVSIALKKNKESSVLMNKCLEEFIIMALVILFFIFPTRNAVRWLGWTKFALIMPIIGSLSSSLILGFALLSTGIRGQNLRSVNFIFSNKYLKQPSVSNALLLVEQYYGVVGVSLMKVCRYVIFNVSKEFFAMRIDIAYRARFRTVYDGVFSRLGKGIGSILQLVFNQIFNTLDIRRASLPYLILALTVGFVWTLAITYLGRKYYKSLRNNEWIDMSFRTK